MFDTGGVMQFLAVVVVVAPAGLLAALGLTSLVGRPLSEARTARAVRWSVGVALLASIGVFVGMLATADRHMMLDLGNWVGVGVEPHAGAAGHAPGQAPHYQF